MSELSNIKIKKINHVGIPINNRKESFSLYMDFLGLKVIPSMVDEKHVIWSKTNDGTMVHLIEPKDGPGNEMPNFHVTFEVENFNETLDILKKSNTECATVPYLNSLETFSVDRADKISNKLSSKNHCVPTAKILRSSFS